MALPIRSGIDRCVTWLCTDVNASSLVIVRIFFGVLMAAGVVRFWAMGWIEAQYQRPRFHFPYWGLQWVGVPPQPVIHVVFVAMFIVALLLAAGRWYRPSAIVFVVGFTWIELVDQTRYLNHYYLVSVVGLLLCLMPLGGRPKTVPRWAVVALRLQLGLVYTFAGIAKLDTDWLLRAEPLIIWLEARQATPLLGTVLAWDPTAYAMAWGGALFDLCIFAALSIRTTRRFAYIAVVVFHFATWTLFPIGLFPWLMIGLTTVFFEPDWPRPATRAVDRATAPPRRADRWILPVLVVHFTAQLLLPLRSALYPGDDRWHMQAFRWSWKVMLVEKVGMVEYRVVDRVSGRRWVVAPGDELTAEQVRMMAIQPDMVLRYAHHLAERFARRGYASVAVYADAWASLNGRRSCRMIDPAVDLALQRDGLAHKAWIVPEQRD